MIDLPKRMQYGFSSIGFPQASLSDMSSTALEFGLDFIELRALGGTVDLPGHFAATGSAGAAPSLPVKVQLVATSLELAEATETDIASFLRFLDVAALVRAPYVRVFGGGAWGDPISEAFLNRAVHTVERCRAEMRKRSDTCEMLLETHSAFSSSTACIRLNERLDEPLCFLWDSHHTWRNAAESPEQTWQSLGALVRHIHFNDSRSLGEGAGHRCVLPGTGEYPVEKLRRLLLEVDYRYGVSLEWEKLWHPELPDVRLALEKFRQLFEIGF